MESSELKFTLDVFEGPLDLLLHLIKTNELEISEISLAGIANQFLETIRLMEHLDLDVAGEYLVTAATLINIKLRALLPDPEEETAEEESDEGLDDFMSAKLLMQRLIEYRRFKEAGQKLGERAERQSQIFFREAVLPKIAEAREDPQVEGDLERLLAAFARVIRFVDRREFHEVQGEEFTIDEKLTLLRRRLVVEERVSLNGVFMKCRSKIEMVVTLLAVLELCRLKELHVLQGDCFDEVLLTPRRAAQGDILPDSEEGEDDGVGAKPKAIAAPPEADREDQTPPAAPGESAAAQSPTAPAAPQARIIELSDDGTQQR
jgi:segregation and condensation protein A